MVHITAVLISDSMEAAGMPDGEYENLLDGKAAQMVCFWYANQKAADLSEKIISSIALEP